MHDLFRREALEAKSNAFLGATVLHPPFAFSVAWAAISAALALLLMVFLIFGEYTKRTRVVGITAPESGVIKLMAPQAGIVIDRRVKEGQAVAADDVLLALSAERMTASGTSAAWPRARCSSSCACGATACATRSFASALLVREQSAQIARRLLYRRWKPNNRSARSRPCKRVLHRAKKQTSRLEELGRQGFMSELAVQQKREEALDQQSRLQALQCNRFAIEREAAKSAADLGQLPLKGEQQLAEIGRNIALIEQEFCVDRSQPADSRYGTAERTRHRNPC